MLDINQVTVSDKEKQAILHETVLEPSADGKPVLKVNYKKALKLIDFDRVAQNQA